MQAFEEDSSCILELNKTFITIKGDKNGYLKFISSSSSSVDKQEDDIPLFSKKIATVPIIGLKVVDNIILNKSNKVVNDNDFNMDKENISSSSSSKVLRVVLASAMMLEFVDPPFELLLSFNNNKGKGDSNQVVNEEDRMTQLAAAMKKVNIVKHSLLDDDDNNYYVFITDHMANIMILTLISNNSLNGASIVWNKFKRNILTNIQETCMFSTP